MKRIVIYHSSTGFTKRYAEWIAKELHCEAKALKKVSAKELAEQDRVIFGGWIMGNMIMGLNKIKKYGVKNLIIFAVGSNQPLDEVKEAIQNTNQLGSQPFFYMQGGIQFEKLGFIKRKMLGMVRNTIAKKEVKTPSDEYMLKALSGSFDALDQTQINALIDFVA